MHSNFRLQVLQPKFCSLMDRSESHPIHCSSVHIYTSNMSIFTLLLMVSQSCVSSAKLQPCAKSPQLAFMLIILMMELQKNVQLCTNFITNPSHLLSHCTFHQNVGPIGNIEKVCIHLGQQDLLSSGYAFRVELEFWSKLL